MSILDTAIDEHLTPFVKPPITQEQLRRYADASGDYNPIHLDEQAAHNVGLDGVIAHGMLSMAFLGQFVNQQIAAIPGARYRASQSTLSQYGSSGGYTYLPWKNHYPDDTGRYESIYSY